MARHRHWGQMEEEFSLRMDTDETRMGSTCVIESNCVTVLINAHQSR